MNGCEMVIGRRGISAQDINSIVNATPDREIQRKVNEMMGVSEEIHARYAAKRLDNDPAPQGDIQQMVNKLMGLSEDIFNKFNNQRIESKRFDTTIDPIQREVNAKLGVSDEVFKK